MILPHNLEMKIFTGNAHQSLAGAICDYLKVGLGDASVAKRLTTNQEKTHSPITHHQNQSGATCPGP